jgi:transcription initiation factor TFIIH subunit 1
MEGQRKGRPGTIVDPRPETVDGEIKIVITPQLVHDIFEEYPVVQRAYAENVGPEVRAVSSLPFRVV